MVIVLECGLFCGFRFLPITLPLAFISGCPGYGHVIVLYFLAASLPSLALAIGEWLVDKRGTEAWGEWIGSYSQGLPPSSPEVRAFRPHQWGKVLAMILASIGVLLTIAGMVMYPQAFLQLIFSNRERSGRGAFIAGLLAAFLAGPAVGGFIGYAYGIHLGALVDIAIRVAARNNGAAKYSDLAEVQK